MGYPDDIKLRSCMTLFAMVTGDYPEFDFVLEKFFGGHQDQKSFELLGIC
jgi:uncharacterized protein (DUF1810 family)